MTLANFLNFLTSAQAVLAWLIAMIVVLLITWLWPAIPVRVWALFAIALIALLIGAFVIESQGITYFALITTLIAAVMLKIYFPEGGTPR
jgi:hypothetical protein